MDADGESAGEQRQETGIESHQHGMVGEQIQADDKIDDAPEKIHKRGRVADAGRFGEGAGEGRSLQAAD